FPLQRVADQRIGQSPRIPACIFLAHLQSQGKPKRKDISAEHRIQLVEWIPLIECQMSQGKPERKDISAEHRIQLVEWIT
nr:hypothetical protein [Tanacetum cinerariifolium]